MKKQLYESKEHYRAEIETLTQHNKQLEKSLRVLERDLPKLRKENIEHVKKIKQLEQDNIELMSQNKQNVNYEAKLLKPLNKKLQTTIQQLEIERQKDQQAWLVERQELMTKLQNIETSLNEQKNALLEKNACNWDSTQA